jgi:uncharacterized protein YkwD
MRTVWRNGLATTLSALALATAAPGYVEAAMPPCGWIRQAPRTATDHQLRTSTLCLVNAARQRHGIAPLAFSVELRRSATAHSQSMVDSGALSHYGPSGSTVQSRVARSGYLADTAHFRLAENIGAGRGLRFGSPLAIVRGWMRSYTHRRNILDAGLRDFGVGIARGAPLGGGREAATYTLDFGVRSR